MNKYNKKEFAQVIGKSVQTVHNWDKKGILVPYRTLGGLPYYTDEHVAKVRNSQ